MGIETEDYFMGRMLNLCAEVDALKQQLAAAREALREAEEVLSLAIPTRDDYPYGRELDQDATVLFIAKQIGYGHLMTLLSAAWRRELASNPEQYGPPGGEFVAGPCRLTVENTLATIRATLQRDRQP